MFYQLPPVGTPVCLHAGSEHSTMPVLSSAAIQFYASGTAALAAAIAAVIRTRPNTDAPEIILPAYACPDLLSAVLFNGAKPVLVDMAEDRPWLDLAALTLAITENTVAIVAVSLFGIAERWSQLRELTVDNNIVLIEDSAQYFPGSDEVCKWHGDLVVLSFGRGKPVSLLGGGAVISNKTSVYESLPKPETGAINFNQRLLFSIKANLYNLMISPYLYWIPQLLPFLHLGETRYHALQDIEAMDQLRIALLPANIASYQGDTNMSARCENISLMLESLSGLQGGLKNLPRICGLESGGRLLRYPLLLEAGLRDRVYRKLKQAGLGVSVMYPASLPKISGVPHVFENGRRYPNAENFASRVITLPTHSGVKKEDIDKIKTILSEQE